MNPAVNIPQSRGLRRGLCAVRTVWMTSATEPDSIGNAPGTGLPQIRSAPETALEPPTKRTKMHELLIVAREAGAPAGEDASEGRDRLVLLVATGAAALMAHWKPS